MSIDLDAMSTVGDSSFFLGGECVFNQIVVRFDKCHSRKNSLFAFPSPQGSAVCRNRELDHMNFSGVWSAHA